MTPVNRLPEANGCATAPEPTPLPNGTPEAPPASGRDGRGRFASGNKGGPGNPFARQSAAFRKALCAAVTEDDITHIAKVLLDMARAGDLAAIKLLLAYVVGRPAEAVDPDTLDIEEWKQWTAAPEADGNIVKVMTSPDTEMLCELARTVRPVMTQTFNRLMLGGLTEQAGRDARRADRKAKRRAQQPEAPMTNGGNDVAEVAPPIANGDNGAPPPPPPLANGDNGEPPPDSAPSANGDNGAAAGSPPPEPLPPHLLKLLGAMLGRAFGGRPPDGTAS